jgi:predicted GTPase
LDKLIKPIIFQISIFGDNLRINCPIQTNVQQKQMSITLAAIGKTGDGKSTLLNTIFGKEEFRTSSEDGRVTLETVTEHGHWRGDKEQKLTCIDTPGLVDKINPDSKMEQFGFQVRHSFL